MKPAPGVGTSKINFDFFSTADTLLIARVLQILKWFYEKAYLQTASISRA
jgi:hypothetical protein